MYLKLPGYRQRLIDNLYEVWLPPIPKREEILGNELRKTDQFWRRAPMPTYYEEKRAEEKYRQEKEQKLVDEGVIPQVTYFDVALERYRRQEWERRIHGIYFMNNGVPTYLTGAHYYYLQWCKMDHPENEGYPLFYVPQLDRFYFRQLCVEDPFSWGYLIVGSRGFGKSSEEVCCMLENMTKPPHKRHAAIQSKSMDDAKEVILQEKMVPMFNEMPDFFKPQFSHGSEPKNKMIFRRSAKYGEGGTRVKHGDNMELGNTITTYSPANKALDGKTLSDLITDEIGKLKPEVNQDAYTRHSVNCRSIYRNHVKRGVIRATTTVEEMEQGGDECLSIWNESDPRVRDGNGYTTSKIYRLFVSAVKTQTDLADKYGNIPEKEAYQKIMNERAPVKEDNYKLSLLMRKNPITEEEAFLKDQTKCQFDVMIISKRISELEAMKPRPGRKYQPEWKNGVVDGDVELVEYKDGPLTLFYDPDEYWNKSRKLLNACDFVMDDNHKKLWVPCNNDFFRASTDPIRYVKTDDGRASLMAGHGGLMFIPDLDLGKPLDQWVSNNIMWEYLNRDTDPEVDYENFIKLMRYFGHSIMPENNAGDFVKHLTSRGYQKFVIVRRDFSPEVLFSKHSKNSLGGDQAVQSNTEVIETYVRRIAAFIRRHGHRINSLPLLRQLLEFTPAKPTKYDLVVSFGYLVLAMEATLDDYFNNQKVIDTVISYFPLYDISGNQSKLIESVYSGESEEDVSDFDNHNYVNALLSGRE